MTRPERLVPVVLQVTGRDPDGSPRELRLVREDETVDARGGEEFVVAHVSERAFARRQ